MSLIKVLKLVAGIATEINPASDSIVALNFRVGGVNGTDLTKSILDTLSAGAGSDASTLHNHDSRYFTQAQHINASTGSIDASKPVITDARGKFDPSFYNQGDITHGNLSGLSADDHPQYYNQSRGDARYFTQASFINATTGVSDAGKPIKTDATGKIDSSFINSSSSNHEQLSGLLGGASSDHYHFTGAEHTTLAGGSSDASSLHNHNTQYYTKTQIDSSLTLKADLTVVIKKDGSVAFTGDQSLGGHKLTNLQDGSGAADAATKGQMDTADGLKVSKSGDTMSGVLNMGANKITNLADPTNPQDAATKAYVDAAQAGLSIKAPVKAASNSNTALTGSTPFLLDGITILTGDRVLLKDQTTTSQNGVYINAISGGTYTLTRATDADTAAKLADGAYVWVDLGTNWADSAWVQTSTVTTLGSDSVDFRRYSGAGQITAGTGLTKTGDTLSVNLGAGIAELPTNDIGLDLYANGGLELVDPTSGNPSLAIDAQLAAKIDGTTLQRSATGLKVRDASITETQLSTSVAGAGLAGGAGTPLAVNAGDGIQIISDAVAAKVSDLAGAGLEDDGSNNLRLKSTVAGAGLSINTTTGVIDVNVDGSTLEINADTIRQKDLGTTRAKLALAAVGSPQIDFGTGAGQVQASQLPIADTADKFVTNNVEAALAELSDAAYIEIKTSGEAIGQGDLVAIRRDGSNNAVAFRASAAAADNVTAASKIIQDVTFTAINDFSHSGNDVSIQYVNPGVVNAVFAISVSGKAITITLATNGSGALTTTASTIVSNVNVHPTASLLVSSAVTGTGSTIQAAQAATFLANGVDYADNGRWKVIGMALDATASAGLPLRVKKAGRLACAFVITPTSADIGKSVYLSVNRGKAGVYTPPSSSNDGIVYLGELVSATELEFHTPVLRGVLGV